jgi:hypothetical protein
LLSPFTVIGLPAPDAEPLMPPSDDTHDAEKVEIELPPSFAGGENVIARAVLPPKVLLIVGGSGTVTAGTAEFDDDDATLVPRLLVAVALQTYTLPFVKPFTMIGLADLTADPLAPPFDEVHDAV